MRFDMVEGTLHYGWYTDEYCNTYMITACGLTKKKLPTGDGWTLVAYRTDCPKCQEHPKVQLAKLAVTQP